MYLIVLNAVFHIQRLVSLDIFAAFLFLTQAFFHSISDLTNQTTVFDNKCAGSTKHALLLNIQIVLSQTHSYMLLRVTQLREITSLPPQMCTEICTKASMMFLLKPPVGNRMTHNLSFFFSCLKTSRPTHYRLMSTSFFFLHFQVWIGKIVNVVVFSQRVMALI